ncbi:hypothetical protein ACIBG8_35120 [Nonomuraea sp. NPDC050556]
MPFTLRPLHEQDLLLVLLGDPEPMRRGIGTAMIRSVVERTPYLYRVDR